MSPTLLLESFTKLGIPEIYTMILIIFIYYLLTRRKKNS
jgi:hypothetical protein